MCLDDLQCPPSSEQLPTPLVYLQPLDTWHQTDELLHVTLRQWSGGRKVFKKITLHCQTCDI